MNPIQAEWTQRVVAEYRSAAYASELLLWLIRIAVSPDTLALAQRVVSDELAHAELSREVLLAAGGSDEDIFIPRETLSLPHSPGLPEELRALHVAADLFCCGETVAVPLFSALREGAEQPSAVAALDRILRDEPSHSALGWTLLDELLQRLGEPARAWLAPQVPACIDRIRRAYTQPGPQVSQELRRWGLMSPSQYATICEACIAERITPRFLKRGLLG